MTEPTISIVLPAYNAEDHITNAINSILNQTKYADHIEVLVIDDGSDDETWRVVSELAAQHSCIKLLSNTRIKGPSGARNTGLNAATGDFIAFLDADDLWYPDHLEKGVDFLRNHNDIDVVFYNFDIKELETNRDMDDWFSIKRYPTQLQSRDIDDNYRLVVADVANALIEESFLHLQAMIVKGAATKNVRFNEEILRSGDRDYAISLVLKGGATYAYSTQKTSVWHRHAQSLTSNKPDNFLNMSLDHIAYFTHYLEQYGTRPNTSVILKKELIENHLDLCYTYRTRRELKKSFYHLKESLKYGTTYPQLRELAKLGVATILFGALGKARTDTTDK